MDLRLTPQTFGLGETRLQSGPRSSCLCKILRDRDIVDVRGAVVVNDPAQVLEAPNAINLLTVQT